MISELPCGYHVYVLGDAFFPGHWPLVNQNTTARGPRLAALWDAWTSPFQLLSVNCILSSVNSDASLTYPLPSCLISSLAGNSRQPPPSPPEVACLTSVPDRGNGQFWSPKACEAEEPGVYVWEPANPENLTHESSPCHGLLWSLCLEWKGISHSTD